MQGLRAILVAALIMVSAGAAAFAQDVTLTSRDGSVEIAGTLIGFDGEFYRVESAYGVLTVDGSGVICEGPGCPDLASYVAELTFSGAPAIGLRLMPALLEAFATGNDYVAKRTDSSDGTFTLQLEEAESGRIAARFNFTINSSDEAFADLLSDEADVGMSLREVLPDEVARGIETGLGDFTSPGQNRVIALDALVPVVSPRNSVRDITLATLAALFAGEVDNWQDLGGADAPVILHLLESGSGLQSVFMDKIMLPADRQLSGTVNYHATAESLVRAVAQDPFAVGITTLSQTGDARALTLVGGCGFRSLAVSESIKSEDYPLTAPLFLYFKRPRLPVVAREFVRFIQSPAAQIAILRAGFVDQGFSRTSIKRQGDRLANAVRYAGDEIGLKDLQEMIETLDGARRLSLTFRFGDGVSALDAQSQSNIVLLARALESGTLGASDLLFAGFSDGNGPALANRRLSRERARSVRDAVLREAATADPARISVQAEGFGEALPMACDDSEWGRKINRRVEVWVR